MSAKIVSAEEPGTLDYDLVKLLTMWHMDGLEVKAILPFGLNIESSRLPDATTTRLAELVDVLRLDYKFIAPPSPQDVECLPHFLGITAYMHAWPYFRADVQYLTAKLGFPALTLPIVLSGEVPSRVSVRVEPLAIVAENSRPKITPAVSEPRQQDETPVPAKQKRPRKALPR
jgi:hypothetical protein